MNEKYKQSEDKMYIRLLPGIQFATIHGRSLPFYSFSLSPPRLRHFVQAAETEMVQATLIREKEKMRNRIQQQIQRMEASQRRIVELESQLNKKEHLLMEQKKYLENVKNMARYDGAVHVQDLGTVPHHSGVFIHLNYSLCTNGILKDLKRVLQIL